MSASASTTSFGIDDDGDFSDLFETLAEVFEISWDFSEDGSPETYGELEALVLKKLTDRLGNKCLLRYAFRRLARSEDSVRLKPSTDLAAILRGRSVRQFLREIARASGLTLSGWEWRSRLPFVELRFAMLGVFASMLLAASQWGVTGAVIAIGLGATVIVSLTQTVFRSDVVTVADLIRASHGSNYPLLVQAHGPGSKQDVVIALQSLCREAAAYSGPIRADTTLLRPDAT